MRLHQFFKRISTTTFLAPKPTSQPSSIIRISPRFSLDHESFASAYSSSVRFRLTHTVLSLRPLPYSQNTHSTMSSTTEAAGPKKVLFFDIDNCLYSKSSGIMKHMARNIDQYFAAHLNLEWDDAVRVHNEYYTKYGLALEGLVCHHQVDALDFNSKVDDAVPLENYLKPDPELRALLEGIDRSKVKVWLFTNAYKTHGWRVVDILGIKDLVDGLTYCDYGSRPFVCKPATDAYTKAMKEAGVENPADCFFVDDAGRNCKAAKELGWTAAHLVEEGEPSPETPYSQFQIKYLRELRAIYPRLFKSKTVSS